MSYINCSSNMVKCPICKKEFLHNPSSIYKMNSNGKQKYYCSYTCWRKAGGDRGRSYSDARR